MEVRWSAPANIAIIKYWGKKGVQLPANPSLSMTLSISRTTTTVKATPASKGSWHYTYNQLPKPEFETKIDQFFERVENQLPFLAHHQIFIDSSNNFPHSSGISSSASFYASLALCLLDLNQKYLNLKNDPKQFFTQASELARLGSGSASRSLYGPWVVWGQSEIIGSNDQYALPASGWIHPIFQSYRDAVIIINSGTKDLSSTAGHGLMNENPYSSTRYEEARKNLNKLLSVLKSGDVDTFIEITEHEALSLHGLIMISKGGTFLMKPATVEAINKIRNFRKQTGSKCCFTLDAGPNLHLLFPEKEYDSIRNFIKKDLLPLAENSLWIDDQIGMGPEKEDLDF